MSAKHINEKLIVKAIVQWRCPYCREINLKRARYACFTNHGDCDHCGESVILDLHLED